jgi:hypothetical protein
VQRLCITADEVWAGVPAAARTVWTARVFPVTRTDSPRLPDRSLDDACALLLQDAGGGAPLPPGLAARWRSLPRVSLREVLERADAGVEFAWRRSLRDETEVRLLCSHLARRTGASLRELLDHIAVEAYGAPTTRLLSGCVRSCVCSQRARVGCEYGHLSGRVGGGGLQGG